MAQGNTSAPLWLILTPHFNLPRRESALRVLASPGTAPSTKAGARAQRQARPGQHLYKPLPPAPGSTCVRGACFCGVGTQPRTGIKNSNLGLQQLPNAYVSDPFPQSTSGFLYNLQVHDLFFLQDLCLAQ